MQISSPQQHNFSQIPSVNIPRSSFDRSHGYKTAFDSGYLIPFLVDEALPGDTFNVDVTAFARMATPMRPVMDNLHMDFHYFAVPLRLVWDNFQRFCGEQVNPGDSTSYVVPTCTTAAGYAVGSLQDYMGVPPGVASVEHSNLFMRAYNLIWNEWFRDENLQDSVVVDKDDGPDAAADYVLLRRGKRHDYFTSCLPWPQKGDSVSIPLGTTAPVYGTGGPVIVSNAADGFRRLATTIGNPFIGLQNAAGTALANSTVDNQSIVFRTGIGAGAGHVGLATDLSLATAATINQLRQSFQIQRMLERDARGGSRYTEIVRSHFGVVSPDARLQRPEYLGGGSTPISVSTVAQTSSTDATTPQGNLAAYATATSLGRGFVKSFTEHCIIIGLVSVRADLTYQQGLNRMFSRSTRYDFYWPSLAQIGEQAVLNKEIYTQGVAADDNVFGYQERFAEYRYKPSQITGILRSTAAGTLDSWHLAQKFTALPALNAAFIVEDPPVDRVIAVPSEPQFIFDSLIRMRCARPMPMYGVPGLIDHF